MSVAMKGLSELLATMKETADKGAKKAAKAGVLAGLQAMSKAIRSGVNGSNMSGPLKKAVRSTIGKRLKKKEGQEYSGKVGFGVGKKTQKKLTAAKIRHAKGGGGGVGISSANVHWLMGTQGRTTESGHRTGAMPDVLSGILAQAIESSQQETIAAAAGKITTVLAAEAAKAKKG